MRNIILTSFFILLSSLSWAMNQPSEIEKLIKDGDIMWLANKQQLAIYKAGTSNAASAILLVPGKSSNPNDPNVIGPLRRLLADHHWQTLSISITHSDKMADNAKQLETGIAALKDKHVKNIILLGYGQGADVALNYALTKNDKSIKGVVLLSARSESWKKEDIETLKKHELPVLDIIAEIDFDEAIRAAKHREPLMNKLEKGKYRHLTQYGAQPYYTSEEAALAKTIHGWLKKSVEQE